MKLTNKDNLWELINTFLDNTIYGVQIADINGNIVYFNNTAKKRLGVSTVQSLHVSDFEPLFKNKKEWVKHLEELRKKENMVIRSVNYNQASQQYIPVEVTVYIKNIQGEEYVFALSRDISKIIHQQEKIDLREKMLIAISDATSELLYNNNFFSAIARVLEIIGNAVNVDRTYLFTRNLNEAKEEVVSQRCEWNSGEAVAQINNPELQNIPLSLFDDFLEMMETNTPFQAIVDHLPTESALREILANQGIISILILPVFFKSKFWGFIGYDECKYQRTWEHIEISILQTLSNNITSALEREDYNQQIEYLAEFPKENPAPVIRINLEGKLLFQNKSELINTATFKRLNHEKKMNFHELLELIAADFKRESSIHYYEVQTNNKEVYSITAKEIKDQSHINLYFSDITKLKITENKLEKTQYIIDQIVSNMEDVIWSVSIPDYRSLFISPSTLKLYGIPSTEFYENSQIWINPIIDEDRYIIQKIFSDLEEKGESDVEYRITTSTGELKWLRNRSKLIYHEDSKQPIRLDGYVVDITTQKKNQELAEQARTLAEESNLAKEEFISSMSHEIRTPLNAILGLSRQLLNTECNDSTRFLNSIVKSASHLQSLVENILDLSKISAGQFKLNFTDMNPYTELNDVFNILENLAKEKKIIYTSDISKDLDKNYSGDKRRFRQIIFNLLSNSIKYTNQGSVSLSAKTIEKSKAIEIKVQDSGIGMSKEFTQKIFDKFSKESNPYSANSEGTGLGMAITKMIIEHLNGDISIDSELGVGTVVRIILPLIKETTEYFEKNERVKDFNRLENKKILIVEDNELNYIVVSHLLKRLKIDCLQAENGKIALEILKEQSFDLILMDLQMPIMGGHEATTIIRNEMLIETPIIGLSANALNSAKSNCIMSGMNAYVTKPFEESTLLTTIYDLIFPIENTESTFDLSNLISNSKDDVQYINEIVTLFLTQVPKQIHAMLKALQEGQLIEIKRIAHKIKPSIMMFGLKGIDDTLEFLNHFNEQDMKIKDDVKSKIEFLSRKIEIVCDDLKEKYGIKHNQIK